MTHRNSSEMKKELTFWQLISDCCEKDESQEKVSCKIVIPTLQRDYAQGRKDQSALRARFLKSLRDTLGGKKVKHLDFVYGNIKDGSSANEKEFIPLDGQQRLTTLWLIHVYVALMAIKTFRGNSKVSTSAQSNIECLLNNFTYKTRTSSVDFINELKNLKEGIKLFKDNDHLEETLSEFIQRQTWFFQGWKQDPTVQSMLRMLSGENKESKKTQNSQKNEDQEDKDCIEKVFCVGEDENKKKVDIKSLYNKLFGDKCTIKFYTLNLDDINQSDDLYIKMNARGEQLSSFENFKADLVEYLQREGKPNEFVTIGNPAYILKKWDVEWTDLFWATQREVHPLKSNNNIQHLEKKNNVDDVFFVFLKRYLLNEYTARWSNDDDKKRKFKNDPCVLYLQQYENSKYSAFDFFEDVVSKNEKEILSNVASVLDELCKIKDVFGDINQMIQKEIPMLKDFCLLPTYQSATEEYSVTNTKVRGITLQQRVVFYGICQFLIKNNKNKNLTVDDEYKVRFKHWLRLLANLSFYSEIENLEAYRLRIVSAKTLTDKLIMTQDLYRNSGYIKMDSAQKDFNSQWEQEKKKILLINNSNNNLETYLKKIEGLWIFRGHIACLLDDNDSGKFISEKVYDELHNMVGERYSHPKENEKIKEFIKVLLYNIDPNKLTEGKEILFNNEHGHIRQQLNGDILKPALVKVLDEVLINMGISQQATDANSSNICGWREKLIKENLWSQSKSCKICMKDGKVYLYHGTRKSPYDTLLWSDEQDNGIGASTPNAGDGTISEGQGQVGEHVVSAG